MRKQVYCGDLDDSLSLPLPDLQDSCRGSGTACWRLVLASLRLSRVKSVEKRRTVLSELLCLYTAHRSPCCDTGKGMTRFEQRAN